MAPEQRRAELRSVLKAPSEREAQDKEPAVEFSPANRRLSEQERSELRQQLRQQRPVVSQDSW